MLGPMPIINIDKMSATDYKKHIGILPELNAIKK